MATLETILNNVDASLNGLLTAIETKQASYAAAHGGRAWQGLATHSTRPADDNATAPDVGTSCPVWQPGEPWPPAVRSGNKKHATQCDCYWGPLGDGYQIIVSVDVLGVTYQRVVNVGPENYREQAWHVMVGRA